MGARFVSLMTMMLIATADPSVAVASTSFFGLESVSLVDVPLEQGDVIPLVFESGVDAARIERRTNIGDERFVVAGVLLSGRGSCMLSTVGDRVAGVIHRDGTAIFLRGNNHLLTAVETPPDRGCGSVSARSFNVAGGASPSVGGTCDDGSTVDLLVAYTPSAVNAAGGTNALLAEIDLAVALTNQAYANSDIALTLNLVATAETPYNEVGSYAQHLTRFTDPDDGVMDEIHALRNAAGADIATLIVADGSLCGTALAMQTLEHEFEALAFNVVTWFCAAGNLSLAHEIGHTMGCAHDRQDSPGGGLFEFSHGHRFQGDTGLWRTVMATTPGSRIGHFSNPLIDFDGAPTGVPAGDPQSADNAETLRQSAFTVANFRCDPALCDGIGPIIDCNVNGLPDDCDITLGFSEDVNRDGIPDECQIPINDVCIGGQLILVGDTAFSTVLATTNDTPDPDCGVFERDIWYRFVAQCTGYVTANVCDATFDTQLAVYAACPSERIDRLACGDDECGVQSEVTFYATPGLYQIRLGGADAAGGTGTLAVICTAGPPCPGDVDLDGDIGVVDLLGLLGAWSTSDPVFDIAPEGGDGTVDVLDLLALLGAWGPCIDKGTLIRRIINGHQRNWGYDS